MVQGRLEPKSPALRLLFHADISSSTSARKPTQSFPYPPPGPPCILPIVRNLEMLRFLQDDVAPNTMDVERGKIYHQLSTPVVSGFCLCTSEFFLGTGLQDLFGHEGLSGAPTSLSC